MSKGVVYHWWMIIEVIIGKHKEGPDFRALFVFITYFGYYIASVYNIK